jgi:cation transport ATPase
VVFGLFLAYESRNVKYECINDSRFVSIAMYIVVILIGVGALLSLVLSDRYIIDAGYIIAVSMIVIACMCALLILYIPKVCTLS